METKTFEDSRMIFLHDSSKCKKCESYTTFYQNLNRRSNSSSQKMEDSINKPKEYQGIISYLRFVFEIKPKILNNLQNQNACDLSPRISLNNIYNEWDLRKAIERNKHKKYLRKEDKFEDAATKKPKNCPLLVCKKQSIHEANKRIFTKESLPSSNAQPEECTHSHYSRCSKILLRKSQWKTVKENAVKVNIPIKEPKLGTLKRKRWNIEKLKTNENYEDDIYAEKKFCKIPGMSEDNLVDSDVFDISTPTFPLTPKEGSRSPIYEDCYDATELSNCRKEAEEYQFLRSKRRKYMSSTSTKDKDVSSQGKNNRMVNSKKKKTDKMLKKVNKILEEWKKDLAGENEDSDSDYYFSDLDDEKEYN
ncbi:uncharacterized protein NPIL_227861 [Nephila pilipes]|uniref:Uncharacterized protein n=1 Tax=Nephila pilipes TaxID=299642 RepID=A0A8X6I646_NEPPI|nr:uncharacterized protein NPIL_227861 [Nephila pilipes]